MLTNNNTETNPTIDDIPRPCLMKILLSAWRKEIEDNFENFKLDLNIK